MYTEDFAPYKELAYAVMAQAAYDYMALYRVHAVHTLRDRVKSEPVRNFKATDLKYLTSQSKRGRKKKVS